jgi:hypothetical protein
VYDVDSYNAPSLNGANTVKSPVACGFSGIVARFCLSFCGTVFVIGNGGPAASIRAAVAPVVALCVSSLEYVGRLQKAVRGFCVAPRKESTREKPVASGSGFPGIVRRGSDLCNTWKGNGPVHGSIGGFIAQGIKNTRKAPLCGALCSVILSGL